VLDDSVAAADHVCRTAGVLVLVDGYNVSKAAWPSLPIARQRARLVDALAELHARTAAEVEVVFDGSNHQPIASSGRTAVRVRFSPDGVEADDVLIDLVDHAPAERPVAVVSSDNRVRDAARRRGANAIGANQLLALLGR
jgi:predicted RNA-binding protein with PIN domain